MRAIWPKLSAVCISMLLAAGPAIRDAHFTAALSCYRSLSSNNEGIQSAILTLGVVVVFKLGKSGGPQDSDKPKPCGAGRENSWRWKLTWGPGVNFWNRHICIQMKNDGISVLLNFQCHQHQTAALLPCCLKDIHYCRKRGTLFGVQLNAGLWLNLWSLIWRVSFLCIFVILLSMARMIFIFIILNFSE